MSVFTGTSGDDSIEGTSGDDDFHLEQGGEDQAKGDAGDDVFFMGASFDAGDSIRGGDGHDFLVLEGDYSAGVAFTATTMLKIDEIDLTAGFSYAFANLTDANVDGRLDVAAQSLGVGDSLHFDASGLVADSISIAAGAGDDVLLGGGGADTLSSGGGADQLSGGGGADSLVGGDGAQTLLGGDGDDFISVGLGAQQISGGDGDDVIGMNLFDMGTKVDGGAGADILYLAGDVTLGSANVTGVETLRASNELNLVIKQSLLVDGLLHVAGSDDAGDLSVNGAKVTGRLGLSGSHNNDKLIGGSGDDTIGGGSGGDTLIGNGGDDILKEGIGNALMKGGAGNDTLTAQAGETTMVGGAGDDFLNANAHGFNGGVDILKGGGGDDTIYIGTDHSTVLGGAGNDVIEGAPPEAHDDRITGGLGQDTITLLSHDTLVFVSVEDSTADAPDQLIGTLNTQTIDLSRIDADTGLAGDQAFVLVGSFSGHAGELMIGYDSLRGESQIQGDVDGDGVADLVIDVNSDARGFSGFVL